MIAAAAENYETGDAELSLGNSQKITSICLP